MRNCLARTSSTAIAAQTPSGIGFLEFPGQSRLHPFSARQLLGSFWFPSLPYCGYRCIQAARNFSPR